MSHSYIHELTHPPPECATALAPSIVSCAAAAAQEFVDPISDVSCIAGAVNDGVNPPAACEVCFEDLKNGTSIKRDVRLAEDGHKIVYMHV